MGRALRFIAAIVAALVIALILGLVFAGVAAFEVSRTSEIAPSEKARALAETISEAMNFSAAFLIFTVPIALVVAWKWGGVGRALRLALAAIAALVGSLLVPLVLAMASFAARAGHLSREDRIRVLASGIAEALYNGFLLAVLMAPPGERARVAMGYSSEVKRHVDLVSKFSPRPR